MVSPAILPYHYSLFCRVIDNYGDIGICWRLAKQLAEEYALTVDFWVDDMTVFRQLIGHHQITPTINIIHWTDAQTHTPPPAIRHIMIEGFACHAPKHLTPLTDAHSTLAPLWINLEYLSAEAWAVQWHLKPMAHQSGNQYIWFPGFHVSSGGLLREHSLIEKQQQFSTSPQHISELWQRLNLPQTYHDFRHVFFIFSYNAAQLSVLLTACANQSDTLVLLADHYVQEHYQHWLSQQATSILCIFHLLPFITQDEFDQLLWLSHLNIVRGEDSLIRAIWAGKPLLWHIYPQHDDVHLIKLSAFSDLWQTITHSNPSWQQALHCFNTHKTVDWASIFSQLAQYQTQTQAVRAHLLSQPDLASKLVQFVQNHPN